jgi:hypothetical protein
MHVGVAELLALSLIISLQLIMISALPLTPFSLILQPVAVSKSLVPVPGAPAPAPWNFSGTAGHTCMTRHTQLAIPEASLLTPGHSVTATLFIHLHTFLFTPARYEAVKMGHDSIIDLLLKYKASLGVDGIMVSVPVPGCSTTVSTSTELCPVCRQALPSMLHILV